MYLKGAKWSLNRSQKPGNPWVIFGLLILIGAVIYINQIIVPVTPPFFIPTPTATRSPESFVTYAENLASQGKMGQAIDAYNMAIDADPKNPSNYLAVARLQVYTGDYSGAVTNAENTLLIIPDSSMAYALRGWALGFLEDYLGAESAVNQPIQIDPNNADAYAFLAQILAREVAANGDTLGLMDKAIDASRTSQSLSPNSLETHWARGMILEATSNYTEAAAEYEAAMAINPNIAELYLSLGIIDYRALELYDKAIEEFNRANALNPADPRPDTYISRTYATVGEYAKAIQYAQQAVKENPLEPSMYGNLGIMYYHNLQYSDAIDALRLAVRGGINAGGNAVAGLPLDYGGHIAEYYFTYGLALARTGECGEALQISQMLLQGVPNDDISTYNANEMVNICEDIAAGVTPTP
jgi:tetratricopeptide (TPR) repeat protein